MSAYAIRWEPPGEGHRYVGCGVPGGRIVWAYEATVARAFTKEYGELTARILRRELSGRVTVVPWGKPFRGR